MKNNAIGFLQKTALLALGILIVWSPLPAEVLAKKAVIVTSIPSQRSLVSAVVEQSGLGDKYEVVSLLDEKVEPERFVADASVVRNFRNAVIWVQIGHPHLNFERTLEDAIDLPEEMIIKQALLFNYDHDDPHVWLSAEANIRMLEVFEEKLARLAPPYKEDIAQAVKQKISLLKTALDSAIAQLKNSAEKKFVVFHPVWGYLAQPLGVEQFALEDHGKEPSPFALSRKIARAREQKIKIVIVQPQFSTASAQTMADEIGAMVYRINPLSDSWFAILQQFVETFGQGASEKK